MQCYTNKISTRMYYHNIYWILQNILFPIDISFVHRVEVQIFGENKTMTRLRFRDCHYCGRVVLLGPGREVNAKHMTVLLSRNVVTR